MLIFAANANKPAVKKVIRLNLAPPTFFSINIEESKITGMNNIIPRKR